MNRFDNKYAVEYDPSNTQAQLKAAEDMLPTMNSYNSYPPDRIDRLAHEMLETKDSWEIAEKNNRDLLEKKISDYETWTKGAGAHSKLGIHYRKQISSLIGQLANIIPSNEEEFSKSIQRYSEAYGITPHQDYPTWSEEAVNEAIKALNDLKIFDLTTSETK